PTAPRARLGCRCVLDEHGTLGRFVPDEPAASAVREVFRRRALGASWEELTEYLEDNQIYPPSTKNPHWSRTGVADLVKNPVYLGQAPRGKAGNENAHEPLVTRGE